MSAKPGKIAVAVVHGIGDQKVEITTDDQGREVRYGFEQEIKEKLHKICSEHCQKDISEEIIVEGVHWADVLSDRQEQLRSRINVGGEKTSYSKLRDFLISFAADAIAYRSPRAWVYKGIHTVFAETMHRLRCQTAPNAPLVIVSHSLGTVVASNYVYDLQRDDPLGINSNIPGNVRHIMGHSPSPLERGQTLSLFYTLGSPLAVWSILYREVDFGDPIKLPPPGWAYENRNVPTEWINFYDKDDVIGFPLRDLNDRYWNNVTEDRQVNVGGFFESRTPVSHVGYFTDDDVVRPIAEGVSELWRSVERGEIVLEEDLHSDDCGR